MSLSQSIKNRIKRKPDLWVFSAADFIDLGSRSAAEKVLSRTCKAGLIDRVYQGLYMQPVVSPMFDLNLPAPMDRIVDAIGRKDGSFVSNSNADAANALKLTNVVQARPFYLTTGKSRFITIGTRKAYLKNMGNKLAKWVDSPAFGSVQALFWLGNDMLSNNADLRDRFWSNISVQAKTDLIKNKNKLPVWAQTVIGAAV